MNIFVLDNDPALAAKYHCDIHVGKMILETAQMVCTIFNKAGLKTPYKSTHSTHPCTLWIKESVENYNWVKKLITALNDEFRTRGGHTKNHKSFDVFLEVDEMFESSKNKDVIFEKIEMTPQAIVVADNCKIEGEVVKSYREYYKYKSKTINMNYKNTDKPHWL